MLIINWVNELVIIVNFVEFVFGVFFIVLIICYDWGDFDEWFCGWFVNIIGIEYSGYVFIVFVI